MSYANDMRSLVKSGLVKINVAKAAAEKAKATAEMDGGALTAQQYKDAAAAVKAAQDEVAAALANRFEKLKADVAAFFIPAGKDLTDDAALFDRHDYEMTEKELNDLFSHYYPANYTMSSMIQKYAAKHYPNGNLARGLYNDLPIRDAASTISAGEKIRSYCVNALSDPTIYDYVLNNEANYQKVTDGDMLAGF